MTKAKGIGGLGIGMGVGGLKFPKNMSKANIMLKKAKSQGGVPTKITAKQRVARVKNIEIARRAKKSGTANQPIKSAYGDFLYSEKSYATANIGHSVKPGSRSVLKITKGKHSGKFLVTSNRRAGNFLKEGRFELVK